MVLSADIYRPHVGVGIDCARLLYEFAVGVVCDRHGGCGVGCIKRLRKTKRVIPVPRIFSERTLVPISLFAAVVPMIFWVGSLAARVDAAEADRGRALAHERATYAEIAQLRETVATIDAKVTTIYEIVIADYKRKRGK